MNIEEVGSYSKSLVTNVPVDQTSDIYNYYKKTIPTFANQTVYIYSFKENKMLYAEGWENVLGYKDDEITMLTIVSITTPRFLKFSQITGNVYV